MRVNALNRCAKRTEQSHRELVPSGRLTSHGYGGFPPHSEAEPRREFGPLSGSSRGRMGNRHCPRKGSRDVCLVPAGELAGLIETAHLRRSPRNGRHLPAAVRRAEGGKTEALNLDDSRLEILEGKEKVSASLSLMWSSATTCYFGQNPTVTPQSGRSITSIRKELIFSKPAITIRKENAPVVHSGAQTCTSSEPYVPLSPRPQPSSEPAFLSPWPLSFGNGQRALPYRSAFACQ